MRDQNLIEQYWLVSRCWNDHKVAIANEMSSEKAIRLLQGVKNSGSPSLRRRAAKLLDDIIYTQDEPDYLQGKS